MKLRKATIMYGHNDQLRPFCNHESTITLDFDVDGDDLKGGTKTLKNRITAAQLICEALVATAIARTRPAELAETAPPPARAAMPARQTANGKGGKAFGPPTTGKQLGGFAKTRGVTRWFIALGARQDPPLPSMISEWPDAWAVWAWDTWQATQPKPTAANGVGQNGSAH
jgi:hypothetical protein